MALMRVRVNNRADATLRRAIAHLPEGRTFIAKSLVREMTRTALVIAPVDTNKYKRSWHEAGSDIVPLGVPRPPLKASQYHKDLLRVLVAQRERIEKRHARLKQALRRIYETRKLRKYKGSARKIRKIQAEMDRLDRRLAVAEKGIAALQQNPWATVIRRKVSYVLAGNERRKYLEKETAIDVEVRNRVYGGVGMIANYGTHTHVSMKLLEPHSTRVERQHQTYALSSRQARINVAAMLRGNAGRILGTIGSPLERMR